MSCFKYKLQLALSLLMLFICLPAGAQSRISVKSFEEDPNETTARVHPVIDESNGEKCALIIITNIGAGGYKFDVGGFSKIENGETREGTQAYFLYVAPGTRSITITNPASDLLPLRNYIFKTGPLKKASTYFMELGNVNRTLRKQYLAFKVTPPNAYLEVEGEPWPLDADGYCAKSVPFGTYNYVAKADGYHSEPGIKEVRDKDNTVDVVLNLRPAFGFLTIDGGTTLVGAKVYVDDKYIGSGNIDKRKIDSGRHTVKIVKDMYSPYSQTVDIKDEQTFELKPVLNENFAEVHVSVDGADIYLDGEKIAWNDWTGNLVPGEYSFEARKEGHRTKSQQITVEPNKGGKVNLVLATPDPIIGTINVESRPRGAEVKVDGVLKGTTPRSVNDVLIGTHTVEILLKGQKPHVETVIVEDGKTATVSHVFEEAIVKKEPAEIPSQTIAKVEEPAAQPEPEIKKAETLTTKAKTDKQRKFGFYILLGGSAGSMTTLEGTIGFRLGHFSVEVGDQYAGLNKEYRYYLYNEAMDMLRNCSIDPGHAIVARAGWTFDLGKRFSVTPLLGYRALLNDSNNGDYGCSSITIGARAGYMFSRNFGVSIAPEYYQKVGASASYNMLKELDVKEKSYLTGFGVNLSFLIKF